MQGPQETGSLKASTKKASSADRSRSVYPKLGPAEQQLDLVTFLVNIWVHFPLSILFNQQVPAEYEKYKNIREVN